jgi:hypothetical protein
MSNKNRKNNQLSKDIELTNNPANKVDEQDAKENLQSILNRLKRLMAKTYISKMVH